MNNNQIALQVAQLARIAADLQRQLAARPQPAPIKAAVPAPVATPTKLLVKRERRRAYFYLRVVPNGITENDIIYRVLGNSGLAEANKIETEYAASGLGVTERMNSREYSMLVENRRQSIKNGTSRGYVGAMEAVALTGPIDLHLPTDNHAN